MHTFTKRELDLLLSATVLYRVHAMQQSMHTVAHEVMALEFKVLLHRDQMDREQTREVDRG